MAARLDTASHSNPRVTWGILIAVWAACGALVSAAPSRADERVVPEARIESARGVALGTGARSSSAATQAQADNPANLVLGGLYHLEAFLGYQPTFKRIGWGAAVVDSMTSRLAAGVSARGLFGEDGKLDNSGWEGRLGLGVPLGDMLSIGLAGRYANYTVSDRHALPEHAPQADMPVDRTFKFKGFTMDAAMTLRPIEGLALAALGYNLIDTESPLAPLMVGGSASFGLGSGLTLGGDVLVDLNTHKAFDGTKIQAGGGLEFLAQGTIPLRGGYVYDQGRGTHAVTGGLGYVDQRFGLQVSVRQVVSGVKETLVFAAIQYFVQ